MVGSVENLVGNLVLTLVLGELQQLAVNALSGTKA